MKKEKPLNIDHPNISIRRAGEVRALEEELSEFQDDMGEMFVLLIGDKGGGSFKLLLQDLSKTKPNSPFSSLIIGEMHGDDNHFNLSKAFEHIKVSHSFSFIMI